MLKYYAKLWYTYMKIGFLTLAQYPTDTIIWFASMVIREAAGFIGIIIIAKAAGNLAGWNMYELCLLFAMCAFIEAIGQAFFDNVWGIDIMIKRGELDVFMTRPASVFLQIQGMKMHLQALFSMVVYIAFFIWASLHIGIVFNLYKILIIFEYIICGTIINTGIYTIFNALNFWLVQGDAISTFVQTCREFVKYPLSIFPFIIRFIFTYVLPLGFVAYYPALSLLDRSTFPVALLMPIVALIVLILAIFIWNAGLKSYNSTGS